MGDGTVQNPFTREDVLRLIEENGGRAEGLDLSEKVFVEQIDLSDLDLSGIKLTNLRLFRANFNGSNLERAIMQKASLGYATFNPLNSKGASLKGVDLRWANLHDAEFRGADLTVAQFQETPVQAVVHPPELQGKLLELLPASLERTDLRGANLFLANFKGCYFYGTKLEGAFIRGADIFEAHLEEVDWGNYKIGEELNRDFYTAERYYRRLKVWYAQSGYDGIAAKFYYREKEAQRKSLRFYYYEKKDGRKSLKLFPNNCRHRIALQLSYLVFGYGEGWKRLLFGWILGGIVLLAAVYYFWGSFSSTSFLDCLYYSATSFSALGYGSWAPQPTGWAKGMGVAEAIIGVFMMALLLVTFVRKWTR